MRLLSFCLRLSLSPPARCEFFVLRDGERASSPTPKTVALRRRRRVASWRFHRGVLMTKLSFLLQCSTTFAALHNGLASAISRRPERGDLTGKDLI